MCWEEKPQVSELYSERLRTQGSRQCHSDCPDRRISAAFLRWLVLALSVLLGVVRKAVTGSALTHSLVVCLSLTRNIWSQQLA